MNICKVCHRNKYVDRDPEQTCLMCITVGREMEAKQDFYHFKESVEQRTYVLATDHEWTIVLAKWDHVVMEHTCGKRQAFASIQPSSAYDTLMYTFRQNHAMSGECNGFRTGRLSY